MEKKLVDIVEENIKPNQAVLVVEFNENNTLDLKVLVSPCACDDVEVDRGVKVVGYALNGVVALFGNTDKILDLAVLGMKVVDQKEALDEAKKDD